MYLYERKGTRWSKKLTLIPTNISGEDFFGRSVSISGNQIASGSARKINNIKYVGSAYIHSNFMSIPESPTPVSPAHNAVDIELPVTLIWTSVAGASVYDVQVADNLPLNPQTSFTVDTRVVLYR